MTGQIGILNVGAGDTKLTFDKSNPAETIRACRIVKDMLRRGYALIIETGEVDGKKTYQRVEDFDAETAEYIIADFDSEATRWANQQQPAAAARSVDDEQGEAAGEGKAEAAAAPAEKSRRGRKLKRVPASGTSGVAISRSAGG